MDAGDQLTDPLAQWAHSSNTRFMFEGRNVDITAPFESYGVRDCQTIHELGCRLRGGNPAAAHNDNSEDRGQDEGHPMEGEDDDEDEEVPSNKYLVKPDVHLEWFSAPKHDLLCHESENTRLN